MARSLLKLSENLVNEMNTRAHADAIAYAEEEVRRAENRVLEAHGKITAFRNDELILDPVADSNKLEDLTGHLKEELADAQRQLSETLQGSPSNPALQALRSRIGALESQIAAEASKIGRGAKPLAPKVQVYERLDLDRQFAEKLLGGRRRYASIRPAGRPAAAALRQNRHQPADAG